VQKRKRLLALKWNEKGQWPLASNFNPLLKHSPSFSFSPLSQVLKNLAGSASNVFGFTDQAHVQDHNVEPNCLSNGNTILWGGRKGFYRYILPYLYRF
jgi:hypothetical protein